ncbi:hypothetical protein C5748_03855 [Phyllobacterium phragmitis]|uniref:Uncharacterized protein n=1 Tax=Phyllobacterium phragmitis TaxID=2670329 RepID=A0A2S9IXT3_9HYPH|nr:hypothetical protein [Phyllobacterium phragmitis]PRD45339.1 hypothetical protein C5748_03855 [Phyllobacterium phragmitis]
MSTVAEIIAKLAAIEPPVFRIVGGAAEFAAIQNVPKAVPAAYVMTLQEASGENERTNGPVLQPTASDIGVVIITGNVSDGRGDASSRDIETLKPLVRKHLIGFLPSSAEDGMSLEHVSGELLKAWAGTVWWQEVYAAASFLEEQPEAGGL